MQVNKQTHAPPILSSAVLPAPAARLAGRAHGANTQRFSQGRVTQDQWITEKARTKGSTCHTSSSYRGLQAMVSVMKLGKCEHQGWK